MAGNKSGLDADNVLIFPGFIKQGAYFYCCGRKFASAQQYSAFMDALPSVDARRWNNWLMSQCEAAGIIEETGAA